jgi:hypothetical protein
MASFGKERHGGARQAWQVVASKGKKWQGMAGNFEPEKPNDIQTTTRQARNI